MAFFDLIPLIGIPMVVMTAGITIDAHNRNKYATPWFLLVSLIGLFGVVFYYITIRTEEQTESAPTPSNLTKIALPFLALLGAFGAFAGIIGVLGGSILVASLYGFPAIAIGILLFHDLKLGELNKQQLFAECTWIGALVALIIGSLMDFARPILPEFSDLQGTMGIVALSVTIPLLWFVFRKKQKGEIISEK